MSGDNPPTGSGLNPSRTVPSLVALTHIRHDLTGFGGAYKRLSANI
jgi:hypothetical protein